MKRPEQIHALRGLGPASESMIRSIGISNVEIFMQSDPFEIYRKLKAANPNTSLNLLYAMIGAQEDRDWKDIASERRTAILMQLDDMGIAP
ncbi:MAG: transcriptional regulator [Oleiphilus sp.]|nr:MAG: transcriptional regulator [Oleiphilus sp.]